MKQLRTYYTPENIAYYCYENNLIIKQLFSLIDVIYEKEFIFIQPEYKYDKESFITRLMNYLSFLADKEEYLKEINEVKNYYKELNIALNTVEETSTLDYFFIKTRLDLVFFNVSYKRIKFRTLLKKYGYKRRSSKFKSRIIKGMIFYHIKGYCNHVEININTIDIDDTITFKLND